MFIISCLARRCKVNQPEERQQGNQTSRAPRWNKVFQYLTTQELYGVSGVCTTFQNLASQHLSSRPDNSGLISGKYKVISIETNRYPVKGSLCVDYDPETQRLLTVDAGYYPRLRLWDRNGREVRSKQWCEIRSAPSVVDARSLRACAASTFSYSENQRTHNTQRKYEPHFDPIVFHVPMMSEEGRIIPQEHIVPYKLPPQPTASHYDPSKKLLFAAFNWECPNPNAIKGAPCTWKISYGQLVVWDLNIKLDPEKPRMRRKEMCEFPWLLPDIRQIDFDPITNTLLIASRGPWNKQVYLKDFVTGKRIRTFPGYTEFWWDRPNKLLVLFEPFEEYRDSYYPWDIVRKGGTLSLIDYSNDKAKVQSVDSKDSKEQPKQE